MPFTFQEMEELKRYHWRQASTIPQDQQGSIRSIMLIGEGILKQIKSGEAGFNFNLKKMVSINKAKQSLSKLKQRNCTTQRRNSPQDSLNQSFYSQYRNNSEVKGEQVTFNDQQNSFLIHQALQKSQYVPFYEHKQNPQKPQLPQKGEINKNHRQKSKVLSSTLSSPVKRFKKHVLEAVQQKRKMQQEQMQRLCSKQKIELNQFYKQNQNHIPLYEKSKILHNKKIQRIQQSRISKKSDQIKQTTFYPATNKKSEQIIGDVTFQERLENCMQRKQLNQQKIIYETLQDFPFKPKVNLNKLTESKIKRIWNPKGVNPKGQFQVSEYKSNAHRDILTLKLGHDDYDSFFKD